MKAFYLFLAAFLFSGWSGYAQQINKTQLLMVTIVDGGRTRMIVTGEDSTIEIRKIDLKDNATLGGLNFKNFEANNLWIVQMLKSYYDKGWKLISIDHIGQLDNDITRYIFSKDQ